MNRITEKEILDYYLNLNGETTTEKTSQFEKIIFYKQFNNIVLKFVLTNFNNRFSGQDLSLEVFIPELDNKVLTIFQMSFYDKTSDIKNTFKYLFFTVKGLKIFLNNYDLIINQIRFENEPRNLIISSIRNGNYYGNYYDSKVDYKDVIIKESFLSYYNKKEISTNKTLINNNNIKELHFNKTYPRTGRLNLCQTYKGTDIDILKLEVYQNLNLKTTRGKIKEFFVLDINKEENTAIIVENNQKYKLINECIIDDNDLVYLAKEDELQYAYDALFIDNRKLCRNWKNSRLLKIN